MRNAQNLRGLTDGEDYHVEMVLNDEERKQSASGHFYNNQINLVNENRRRPTPRKVIVRSNKYGRFETQGRLDSQASLDDLHLADLENRQVMPQS